MNKDNSSLYIIGACFVSGIALLILLAYYANDPKHKEYMKKQSTKEISLRIDKKVSELIFSKHEETGLCFAVGKTVNSIYALTEVPCSDKVLEIIRIQREGNEPK